MLLTLSANTLWVEDFQLRRGEVTQVTLYLVPPPPTCQLALCKDNCQGQGEREEEE